MARTGKRPEKHNQEEPSTRAQSVYQLSTARIHQRVGEEKGGIQIRELRIANGNVVLNCGYRHGQRLAVQVADGDRRADEESDLPPK